MSSAAPKLSSAVDAGLRAESAPGPGAPAPVAVFPFIGENPYQGLLYREVAAFGFDILPDKDFKLRQLVASRGRIRVLHFHWPQNYYSWWRRPARLRSLLSWPKLLLFAIRLTVARRLGYAIVWTIHEVFPHERRGRGVDKLGARLLARAAHLLITLDRGTARRAEAVLGVRADRIEVVPHASMVGFYPAGRSRDVVRAELGIAEAAFVFLCFGHVRAYKELDLLLRAFASLPRPDLALVIAGLPMDAASAEAVRGAATADARIKPLLEFVPDERVAELFNACDAAVLTRGDGGTSGALVLALSMAVPVVVADVADYTELTGGDDAAWLFSKGDASSLGAALAAAAEDADIARAKGANALKRAERISWPQIGSRTAQLLARAIEVAAPRHTEPRRAR
jgi:glycosyltransferase involved in cell wall biosynthesis